MHILLLQADITIALYRSYARAYEQALLSMIGAMVKGGNDE